MFKRRAAVLILVMLTILFGVSCKKHTDSDTLSSIAISVSDEVIVGSSVQGVAEDKEVVVTGGVKWSVSDETVAKIDANGKMTTLKIGDIKITAEKDGVKAEKTVSIVAEVPNFTTVHIVGTLNAWSFGKDESEMRYIGNGVYEKTITAPAASTESWIPAGKNQGFKIATNGKWTSDGGGPQYIEDEKNPGHIIVDAGMGNMYAAMTEGKKYVITVNFKKMTVNIREAFEKVSIVGTLNAWSFDSDEMDYQGNGVYTKTITAPAASTESWIPAGKNQAFKIATNGAWANNGGGPAYIEDEKNPGKLIVDAGMGNSYASMTEGKKYTIKVDFNNMTIVIEETTYSSVHIVGTINGWSFADGEMKSMGNGVYVKSFTAPAPQTADWIPVGKNQAFKVATNGKWTGDGGGPQYVEDAKNPGHLVLDSGMDNSFGNFEEGKTYLATVNMKEMTVKFEKVDPADEKLLVRNVNEYIDVDSQSVNLYFRTNKGAKVSVYTGESPDNMKVSATVDSFAAEGVKVSGLTAGKKYFYKVVIEKNGKSVESDVQTFTKSAQKNYSDRAEWARTAIFYEVFVRSFYDSDGDGIGDFKGVAEKADYLKSLNVDAVWLMPMMASPTYHGYDITDYKAVQPDYGTMSDFNSMVTTLHSKGIKVIIDFVVNHTSNQNEWFKQSVADAESKYKNYYVWANEFDNMNDERWRKASNGKYYFGDFTETMPDLNYRNVDVRSEIKGAAKFWLDAGVDGFRLDASHKIDLDADVTHLWWQDFTDYVKSVKSDAFIVGENWYKTTDLIAPFIKDMDSSFNFPASQMMTAMANGATNDMIKEFTTMKTAYSSYNTNYIDSIFLTNHDMQRTGSILGKSVAKEKVAATLLFTLPGTPFIYYGEEIGQFGDQSDPNVREPLDWYKSASGTGMTTMKKFGMDMKNTIANDGVSVEEQAGTAGSLLEYYKKLSEIRVNNKLLFTGKYELIGSPAETYAYMISDAAYSYRMYVVYNQAETSSEIEVVSDGTEELISGKIYNSGDKIVMAGTSAIILKHTGSTKPIKDYPIIPIVIPEYTVTFRVTVPQNTPDGDSIYMPSDINEWDPATTKHKLTKIDSTTFELKVTGKKNSTIKFKFTRGAWTKREQDANGKDIADRIFTFTKNSEVLDFTVASWMDLNPAA